MNIGGSNHRSLKKMLYERKSKKPIACIPFQSTTDSLDKSDSWRTWSCIRLAHLLKDAYAIQSFNTAPGIADMKTGNTEEGIISSYQGKYSWKSSIEVLEKDYETF